MKKSITTLLIVALALIVVGAVIACLAFGLGGFKFSDLNTEHYEIMTAEITEDISELTVNTTSRNVRVIPSNSGTTTVTYPESERVHYNASVNESEDGSGYVLDIKESLNPKEKWFGINIDDPEIVVALSAEFLDMISVVTTSGDIAVEKVRAAAEGQYDLVLMDVRMPDKNGIDALKDVLSANPKAREKMANAATMAGMAFANAFLGVMHSMAHKLGAFHHLPRGVANALMIEEVLRFNAAEAPAKMGTFSQYDHPHTLARYAEVADALGLGGKTDEEKAETKTAKSYWPYPSYADLLFSVR